MATITLKGVPDELKERIQVLAGQEGRSLNQQATTLLKRTVLEKPTGFDRAYQRFREKQGESPLEEGDLNDLRSEEA